MYIILCCVFDLSTPVNILGVPALGTFFGDNVDATDTLAEDGTTIKLGSTKSHLIWDYSRQERHFMHGSRHMPELYVYVGHGYFTYFYTIVHKFISENFHFSFSPAYSIYPHTSDKINPDGPHVIP